MANLIPHLCPCERCCYISDEGSTYLLCAGIGEKESILIFSEPNKSQSHVFHLIGGHCGWDFPVFDTTYDGCYFAHPWDKAIPLQGQLILLVHMTCLTLKWKSCLGLSISIRPLLVGTIWAVDRLQHANVKIWLIKVHIAADRVVKTVSFNTWILPS